MLKPLFVLALMLGTGFLAETGLVADDLSNIEHRIVAIQQDRFHAWPANNGGWQWENELLVGFTQGDFEVQKGHDIGGRQNTMLTRSLDGGETWTFFDPENLLDDDNPKYLGVGKTGLKQPMEMTHPDFTLRIFSSGYHGNDDPVGGFFYSSDRGKSWNGPHAFTGLLDAPELKGKMIAARTDYIVQDKNHCFIYIATYEEQKGRKRIACIETTDGGLTFDFVSWVTPETNEYSSIMCQTVQVDEHEFVLTYRKIFKDKTKFDTIETYRSTDGCQTWTCLGTLKEMKTHSNPPALVKLQDGRLCCAYGDRYAAEIRARYSHDNGETWGPELVIRDDFQSRDRDLSSAPTSGADMGYPRLFQRPDGKLVVVYYWATAEHPQQHIACSIWEP